MLPVTMSGCSRAICRNLGAPTSDFGSRVRAGLSVTARAVSKLIDLAALLVRLDSPWLCRPVCLVWLQNEWSAARSRCGLGEHPGQRPRRDRAEHLLLCRLGEQPGHLVQRALNLAQAPSSV